MAPSEERQEQLDRSLQQAGSALQAANYKIATLEPAAGTATTPTATTTPSASARTTANDMGNVNLTPAEQVWSRLLYYMLSLSTSVEAQRRLQNVPEGEGAEA